MLNAEMEDEIESVCLDKLDINSSHVLAPASPGNAVPSPPPEG